MKTKNIFIVILINFIIIRFSHAKTIELCQAIVDKVSQYEKFPRKGQAFTELQPICVLDKNGNAIYKITTQVNKNNFSNYADKEKIINDFVNRGHSVMCKDQKYKRFINTIDVRVEMRLEENINKFGAVDLNIETCRNF